MKRCFSAPLRKYKRLCYSESLQSSCGSNKFGGSKISSSRSFGSNNSVKWNKAHDSVLLGLITEFKAGGDLDWNVILGRFRFLTDINYSTKQIVHKIKDEAWKNPAIYKTILGFDGDEINILNSLVTQEESEKRMAAVEKKRHVAAEKRRIERIKSSSYYSRGLPPNHGPSSSHGNLLLNMSINPVRPAGMESHIESHDSFVNDTYAENDNVEKADPIWTKAECMKDANALYGKMNKVVFLNSIAFFSDGDNRELYMDLEADEKIEIIIDLQSEAPICIPRKKSKKSD